MLDLETKVAALEEELAAHGGGSQKRGKEDALPRAPEKYSLTGHRNAVNSVRFHPTFSLLASASEDATVKISPLLFHGYILLYSINSRRKVCAALIPNYIPLTSIWIWDYESGEFERTLRGHTNAVQDLDFDKTGNLLGINNNRSNV